MKEQGKKKNAAGILHRRYIGDDADRKASLQTERITERLNSVYDQEVSELDPMLARMQFSGSSHEDW